ncbi:MAG: phosphate acyltransferase PlsX [Clostridia bacterium]|nr:phosphate acyltransferase PlsX [Clostridia bacterium]
MRIVVDAMGGDFAPREIVDGAIEAATKYGVGIILVGQQEAIQPELARHKVEGLDLEVVHASEVIDMGEHPANAIRKKKDSSIMIGIKLVKEGRGDAFISAGNTGAAMAAALFGYGRIKGIDRPAIASPMPTTQGAALILDAGANADCKPRNLLQFGIMGQIYAEKVLGVASPKVALLNIGEEETKGNELSLEAYQLMKNQPGLNFTGNVEGREIPQGAADVVVCDGFVGNVVLKFAEGLAKGLLGMIKEELSQSLLSKIGGALCLPALTGLKKRMDYAEYGGAPLLGVNGICIISHGSSKAKAIMNAVRVAKECVEQQVVQAIRANIEQTGVNGDD